VPCLVQNITMFPFNTKTLDNLNNPFNMVGNIIKYLFGFLVLVLLGFIAFNIFQDKYMKTDDGKLVVEEERISDFIVLEKIEAMGKIELVKYQLKDAVSYSDKRSTENFLIPDRKILLILSGEAVGCIDFTQIKRQHISITGDSVFVALPQPELCYAKINHQDCKVFDLSTAKILDKTDLIDMAYKMAEKRVEKMAMASNIMDETKHNAELLLKPLLEQLTEKKVIFSYQLAPEEETPELKVID